MATAAVQAIRHDQQQQATAALFIKTCQVHTHTHSITVLTRVYTHRNRNSCTEAPPRSPRTSRVMNSDQTRLTFIYAHNNIIYVHICVYCCIHTSIYIQADIRLNICMLYVLVCLACRTEYTHYTRGFMTRGAVKSRNRVPQLAWHRI